MNEQQNNLKSELDIICESQYYDDKNRMMLDLLVVLGYWAEFEVE